MFVTSGVFTARFGTKFLSFGSRDERRRTGCPFSLLFAYVRLIRERVTNEAGLGTWKPHLPKMTDPRQRSASGSWQQQDRALTSHYIRFNNKYNLCKSLVVPILFDGCDTWTHSPTWRGESRHWTTSAWGGRSGSCTGRGGLWWWRRGQARTPR